MRATSYLGIAVAVVIGGAFVVALFVDETKSVATYVAIFGALGLAIGAVAGIVRGELRERRHSGS